MPVFIFIFLLLCAGLFYLFAWLFWKKQMISLVHDYHRGHVRREDIPAYTRLYGWAMFALGSSILLMTLVIFFTDTQLGWLIFAPGTVIGAALIIRAQNRYNRIR